MTPFTPGDRVAWSHAIATQHGAGSVLRRSMLEAQDPCARYGTVTRNDNAGGTWVEVQLDPPPPPKEDIPEFTDDNGRVWPCVHVAPVDVHGLGLPDLMVLTSDELVKIEERS